MSGKRVAVITPDGKFGTIDEKFAEEIELAGGRTLTPKEASAAEAQAREDERYAKLPAAQKVIGGIGTALSTINPLTIGSTPGAPQPAAAYSQGVTEGLTGGLAAGLTRQGIDYVAGHEAGDKYAQHVEDQRLANPIAHGVGEAAGLIGGGEAGAALATRGAQIAARLSPRIAAAGATIGDAAGAVASRGVLGKAAVEATKLGLRGAAEGGGIGGAQYAGEQLLQDHDVATDKLFGAIGNGAMWGGGTGAVLGGGGSLLASGGATLRKRAASSLAKSAELGAEAAGELEGVAGNLEAGAQNVARDVESTAKSGIRNFISDFTTEQGTKNRAYDQLFSQVGSGRGLQSTDTVKRARRYLPNGERDISEVWMRKGVFDPNADPIAASKAGSAAVMLPKSEAAREAVGKELGDLTSASGGRVAGKEIMGAVERIAQKYDRAATKPIARAIRQFGNDLDESLKLGDFGVIYDSDGVARKASNVNIYGKRVYNDVPVQELIAERKAVDRMVFGEVGLDANATIEAKRELRSELEDLVVKAIDETSGKMPGELKSKYLGLKKDYLALSIGTDLLEDTAARDAKAAMFGLSDLTAGGGSFVKTVAYKIAKQNVHAVAAAHLYQAAEKGTIARWLNKTDDQIERASKGLLTAPEKGAAKASEVMPPPRGLVTKALARVAAFEANPDDYVDHAAQQVESIATHSPEIANGLVARQVQAMTFLRDKLPDQGAPDPLDPHPRVHMTPTEEATFARYAWYTEKPERFFAEVARGKLTPEGAEVAHALMPRAFEQLQTATADALTTQLARGNKLPFRQRELLGQLLDFAATPAQRPEHRAFLQQNVSDVLPSKEPLSGAPASKRRATTTPSGSSALDRLEARGPGRR